MFFTASGLLYYILLNSSYTAKDLLKMGFSYFDISNAAELIEKKYENHLYYINRIAGDLLLKKEFLNLVRINRVFDSKKDNDFKYIEHLIADIATTIFLPSKDCFDECYVDLSIFDSDYDNIKCFCIGNGCSIDAEYTIDYGLV